MSFWMKFFYLLILVIFFGEIWQQLHSGHCRFILRKNFFLRHYFFFVASESQMPPLLWRPIKADLRSVDTQFPGLLKECPSVASEWKINRLQHGQKSVDLVDSMSALMIPRVVNVTHYNVENKHYILKKLSLHSDHQLLIVLNLVLTIGLGTT